MYQHDSINSLICIHDFDKLKLYGNADNRTKNIQIAMSITRHEDSSKNKSETNSFLKDILFYEYYIGKRVKFDKYDGEPTENVYKRASKFLLSVDSYLSCNTYLRKNTIET